MPQSSGGFLWLGLANIGLSGVYLNQKKNFGATIDIGQTILEPYFRLNGYLVDKLSLIHIFFSSNACSIRLGALG